MKDKVHAVREALQYIDDGIDCSLYRDGNGDAQCVPTAMLDDIAEKELLILSVEEEHFGSDADLSDPTTWDDIAQWAAENWTWHL